MISYCAYTWTYISNYVLTSISRRNRFGHGFNFQHRPQLQIDIFLVVAGNNKHGSTAIRHSPAITTYFHIFHTERNKSDPSKHSTQTDPSESPFKKA
ncbi:unnamed protein product [Ceratitis capitata]|uniref:(Mediterranean fruit fly) hypothetical protein n=1 Tax=Ceratitis capitata TaxID=7213 RepID=A0A811VJQ6_CERCA|nr:unnamed protein product [Ceratitis capitata]